MLLLYLLLVLLLWLFSLSGPKLVTRCGAVPFREVCFVCMPGKGAAPAVVDASTVGLVARGGEDTVIMFRS